MQGKYFVPVVGQIYRNRSSWNYRCTGNAAYADENELKRTVTLGEHRASMIRLTDGWAIDVKGLCQYEDGTVEWAHSIGGSFQSENLARCWQSCGDEMYKYFDYLDHLRDSGAINMMGAIPYLQRRFLKLCVDPDIAKLVLMAWMDSYSGRRTKVEQ